MRFTTILRRMTESASQGTAAHARCLGWKQMLVALAAGLTAVAANGQQGGTVNFGNHNASKVMNGKTGLPVTADDAIRVALYWAPLGSEVFTRLGEPVNVGVPLPGLFVGGTRITGLATAGGGSGQFQVRAWSGGYASYEEARQHQGELIGRSTVITNLTGDPWGNPPTPPTSLLAGGLAGFTVLANNLAADPPTISCTSNKNVACGSAWLFDTPIAVDGCTSNSAPVYVLSTITNGDCPRVITRTWAATNSCDTNYATCSQTVSVVDTNPPALAGYPDKTVACGVSWDFDWPVASDSCSGTNVAVSVLQTQTNGACPRLVTRWWLATDPCGNTNTCSQSVTVVDTAPPVLTCVSDKTVDCAAAWNFDSPGASDSCSGTNVAVTVLLTVTNGNCPRVITRSWLAIDACGNTNTCSQAVTVVNTSAPMLTCVSNKTVNCEINWAFDVPQAWDPCFNTSLPVWVVDTVNTSLGPCTQFVTRTWVVTNACNTNTATCSQSVTVTCSNCPLIAVSKQCPPYPVPPGGTLSFSGTVSNLGNVALTNVLVVNDQPTANTLVFGPATLDPGESRSFSASYRVPACSCGPFTDTLVATAMSSYGGTVTNSYTSTCVGTNAYAVAGDMNGDGIVDQSELNAVLANYWASSQWVYMTNPTALGSGFFQFELTNATGWNFTVLASTNLVDWTNLPSPAYPVYQFYDPAAVSNAPLRAYRLRWP
jgi:hypothetical protein